MELAQDVLTLKVRRWFCMCVTPEGENVILVARTASVAEASQRIHQGYSVDYIEDILTPKQMDMRKAHLRKDYTATAILF